jgi:hypothetical protein
VALCLWPTDLSVEVPVSIAVLIASAVFFFLGALFVWFGSVAARGRARRAERHARTLEKHLKAQVAPPPIVVAPARPAPPRFTALPAPK